ncbi:MAG: DUF177 domain-containing protein [Bacteroidales bacterium]|nr:DUF177 domain-containing protein [Bacteroidales bacterium]
MGRFDKYNIDLKGLKTEPVKMEFNLDNAFFADIEGEEFQKGNIKAVVTAKKNHDVFDFDFTLAGTVTVACDRCLDDLDIEVETENSLRVKLGDDYADDGDTVIVPEQDGDLNIAWYLYEFVALALPMKRVHAPGKCNREMTGKLGKHTRGNTDEGDDTGNADIDPRWESLKNIQIEEDI